MLNDTNTSVNATVLLIRDQQKAMEHDKNTIEYIRAWMQKVEPMLRESNSVGRDGTIILRADHSKHMNWPESEPIAPEHLIRYLELIEYKPGYSNVIHHPQYTPSYGSLAQFTMPLRMKDGFQGALTKIDEIFQGRYGNWTHYMWNGDFHSDPVTVGTHLMGGQDPHLEYYFTKKPWRYSDPFRVLVEWVCNLGIRSVTEQFVTYIMVFCEYATSSAAAFLLLIVTCGKSRVNRDTQDMRHYILCGLGWYIASREVNGCKCISPRHIPPLYEPDSRKRMIMSVLHARTNDDTLRKVAQYYFGMDVISSSKWDLPIFGDKNVAIRMKQAIESTWPRWSQ